MQPGCMGPLSSRTEPQALAVLACRAMLGMTGNACSCAVVLQQLITSMRMPCSCWQ